LLDEFKNRFHEARTSFEDQLAQAVAAVRAEQEHSQGLEERIVQLEADNQEAGLAAIGRRTVIEETNAVDDTFTVRLERSIFGQP